MTLIIINQLLCFRSPRKYHKVVAVQLMENLKSNLLISKTQHSFQANPSMKTEGRNRILIHN